MSEKELIQIAEKCDTLDDIGKKQICLQIAAIDLYNTTKEEKERKNDRHNQPAPVN